jgi:hypothetical protein
MFSDFPSGMVEIVRSFYKFDHTSPFQEGTIEIAIFPSSQNLCNTFKIKKTGGCRSMEPFIFDQFNLREFLLTCLILV